MVRLPLQTRDHIHDIINDVGNDVIRVISNDVYHDRGTIDCHSLQIGNTLILTNTHNEVQNNNQNRNSL